MTCVSSQIKPEIEDPSLEGGTNSEADTSGHNGSMKHSSPCGHVLETWMAVSTETTIEEPSTMMEDTVEGS